MLALNEVSLFKVNILSLYFFFNFFKKYRSAEALLLIVSLPLEIPTSFKIYSR